MSLIKITTECNRCGLCVRACPYGVLGYDENGAPSALSDNCIRCGHCTAVCPKGALENALAPLSSQLPVDKTLLPDADSTEYLLKSRRSIREYRIDPVPEDALTRLLSSARYAPTGFNLQGAAFRVISRPELLRQLSAATLEWAEEELRRQTPFSQLLAPIFLRSHTAGSDVVLHNAPCLILSLLPMPLLPFAVENGRFPLLYSQLFAPSLGLGSCWVGILEQCIRSGYAPVLEALDIPEGMGFAGAMVVGYPSYSHSRIPARNPLSVTWQR